ncbi:hypothetical protein BD770DRAFT_428767 [Pilaira anomala]|nr:hypothetical protein BD770DRAFT_428767 [Pilaira anomala]
MAPPTTENEGVRRRSLSGASALIARRFTRQTSAPRPTASRSESTTRRRATIADTTTIPESDIKVHVRIVPNIENPSRSLIFDIVDRELQVGSVIRIGRYSERHANLNCMSFKSKVVSRCHSEVWVETDGKLYIRDTKSSSGTFLNHVRLSPAGNESRPVELNDGDIVQLGVDFQGGREEMYRSVKMRFELNRSNRPRPLSFSLNAFQNLRNLTQQQTNTTNTISAMVTEHQQQQCATNNSPALNNEEIDECCICLYALAPFQALFVSPCSHTYHFKCIRPLLSSYPGFQCPICRTYSDLEASVAIEAEEVMEQYTQHRQSHTNALAIEAAAAAAAAAAALQVDSGLGLQPDHSDYLLSQQQDNTILLELTESPLSTPSLSSPVNYSEIIPDSSLLPLEQEDIINHQQQVIEEPIVTNDPIMIQPQPQEIITSRPRERRTSHIMEKIKMVFFEKRKSAASQSTGRQKRPLSYPLNVEQVEGASTSRDEEEFRIGTIMRQTLSRQSTTHLNEFDGRETNTIQQVHVS